MRKERLTRGARRLSEWKVRKPDMYERDEICLEGGEVLFWTSLLLIGRSRYKGGKIPPREGKNQKSIEYVQSWSR